MTVTDRPAPPAPEGARRSGFSFGRREPVRLTEVGRPEEVDLARHPRATLAVLGAVLLLAVVVVLGLRSTFERSSEDVEAPRVVLPVLSGLAVSDAQGRLEALGVQASVDFTPNAAVPAGSVFAQTPRSGAKVEVGSEVVLQVSDGPAGVIVPEVGRVQTAIAAALFARLGLAVDVVDVTDDVVPAGEVVGTVPAAGSPAPPSGVVELRVSSGPAPRTVPEVIGMEVGPGMSAIGRAGLGLGEVDEEVRDGVEPGVILRVQPSPGAAVPPRTPVDVVVSGRGESEVTPSLVGLSQATAEQVADGVVTLRVRTQRLSPGDRLVGRVLDQSIPPGVAIEPGTTLEVVVGAT